MYNAVFIDLDDTLWDFHANAKSSLQEIYEKRNLGQFFDSFDQYFTIYAKRNVELWEEYGKGTITKEVLSLERFLHPLIQVGINNSVLAKEIGEEYLELLPTRTALVPYAKELLEYLYPKYPLTIVSNGFVEVQYKKLHSCHIEQYFTHVVLSEAAKALKPDKRIFDYAMELNSVKASETIMIGDSYEADIMGAQNACIDRIYYNPDSKLNGEDNSTTYQVRSLKEIMEVL
ncbi:MAG: YjjG family noncanonical pyrimidine nucleotidase [Bacteroidota bacterium]|nr:YjjG family noncanonical pyrimidine nucleotidase [Bacteroidota bacterium]